MVSIELLSAKAKQQGFKLVILGGLKYSLLKEGVIGGGYQGKITECFAYLSGWEASKSHSNG